MNESFAITRSTRHVKYSSLARIASNVTEEDRMKLRKFLAVPVIDDKYVKNVHSTYLN
uniref:Uncharacterized protein n=1 Tax=Heterorhabditis bacteriophora TaxID=37862 RepID=A0A1I7WIR2_HETBA